MCSLCSYKHRFITKCCLPFCMFCTYFSTFSMTLDFQYVAVKLIMWCSSYRSKLRQHYWSNKGQRSKIISEISIEAYCWKKSLLTLWLITRHTWLYHLCMHWLLIFIFNCIFIIYRFTLGLWMHIYSRQRHSRSNLHFFFFHLTVIMNNL